MSEDACVVAFVVAFGLVVVGAGVVVVEAAVEAVVVTDVVVVVSVVVTEVVVSGSEVVVVVTDSEAAGTADVSSVKVVSSVCSELSAGSVTLTAESALVSRSEMVV